MEITQKLEDLLDKIKMEVSYIADHSYSEDGKPLYDAIRFVSRDSEMLEDVIKSAVAIVEQSMYRFATNSDEDDFAYFFIIPDGRRASGNAAMLEKYVSDAVVRLSVSKYLSRKGFGEEAKKYDEMAAADIALIQKTIYSKSQPTR